MDGARVCGCLGVPRASRRPDRLARAAPRSRRRGARSRLRRRRPRGGADRARAPLPRSRLDAGDGRRCSRLGSEPRATVELGDLNELRAVEPGGRDDGLPRDLLRARPSRVLRPARSSYTQKKLVFDLNPRQYRRRGRGRGSPRDGIRLGRAAAVLRPADRLAPRAAARRGQGARAQRPRSRASRCERASPTSSRRRASSPNRGWKPARSTTAPSRRRSLFDGSTSAGTKVGATVISMRHGTLGGLSVAPFGFAVGDVEPPRLGHAARSAAACPGRSPRARCGPSPFPSFVRPDPGTSRLPRQANDRESRARRRRRRSACTRRAPPGLRSSRSSSRPTRAR